jgi:hypothetical protein
MIGIQTQRKAARYEPVLTIVEIPTANQTNKLCPVGSVEADFAKLTDLDQA